MAWAWILAAAAGMGGGRAAFAVDPDAIGATRILPHDVGGLFGGSSAIAGHTLVVGSEHYYGHGIGARGAAFVFQHAGGEWTQAAALTVAGHVSQHFGRSVATDGATIIAGDPTYPASSPSGTTRESGVAYVFERSATGWLETAKLTADVPTHDGHFGQTVAISGTTAFVNGRQGVDVFEKSGDVWSRQTTLLPSLGDATGSGLTGFVLDGNTAILAASVQDVVGSSAGSPPRELINSGRAFVFERDATGWRETAVLAPPDPLWRGSFGASLDLSGTTAILGRPGGSPAFDGPHRGAAYIYDKVGDAWVQTAKLEPSDSYPADFFGSEVAISGNFAAVSASGGEGRVYLFAKQEGQWREVRKISTGAAFSGDQFGVSLALDAGQLVIGARLENTALGFQSGAAYVIAVPEPGASVIGLAGLIAAASTRRRPRKLGSQDARAEIDNAVRRESSR